VEQLVRRDRAGQARERRLRHQRRGPMNDELARSEGLLRPRDAAHKRAAGQRCRCREPHQDAPPGEAEGRCRERVS
jgi:hypothetical protein